MFVRLSLDPYLRSSASSLPAAVSSAASETSSAASEPSTPAPGNGVRPGAAGVAHVVVVGGGGARTMPCRAGSVALATATTELLEAEMFN